MWFLLQETSAQPGAGFAMGQIFFIIAIFGVFYFFMVRPQQKRAKEEKTFQDNLSKGDKVMTIGGVLGTVEGIEDQSVKVRVDANTVIRFTRTAIRPAPAADKKD